MIHTALLLAVSPIPDYLDAVKVLGGEVLGGFVAFCGLCNCSPLTACEPLCGQGVRWFYGSLCISSVFIEGNY